MVVMFNGKLLYLNKEFNWEHLNNFMIFEITIHHENQNAVTVLYITIVF